MTTDRALIDKYYAARGLVMPDEKESLLWLISEVGELCETWLRTHFSQPEAIGILVDAYILGRRADDAVANDGKGWIRNKQPKTEIDMAGEIADVFMMLDRFARAAGMPEPAQALLDKMHRKAGDFDNSVE